MKQRKIKTKSGLILIPAGRGIYHLDFSQREVTRQERDAMRRFVKWKRFMDRWRYRLPFAAIAAASDQPAGSGG